MIHAHIGIYYEFFKRERKRRERHRKVIRTNNKKPKMEGKYEEISIYFSFFKSIFFQSIFQDVRVI
jgi:hypothetical protein